MDIEILNMPVNGHAVGIIMKEMVRRAIEAIRHNLSNFKKEEKMIYGGAKQDIVTSADKVAQQLYIIY